MKEIITFPILGKQLMKLFLIVSVKNYSYNETITKLYSNAKKELMDKGKYNTSLDDMYIDIGLDDFPPDFDTLLKKELDKIIRGILKDQRILSYSIKHIDCSKEILY